MYRWALTYVNLLFLESGIYLCHRIDKITYGTSVASPRLLPGLHRSRTDGVNRRMPEDN